MGAVLPPSSMGSPQRSTTLTPTRRARRAVAAAAERAALRGDARTSAPPKHGAGRCPRGPRSPSGRGHANSGQFGSCCFSFACSSAPVGAHGAASRHMRLTERATPLPVRQLQCQTSARLRHLAPKRLGTSDRRSGRLIHCSQQALDLDNTGDATRAAGGKKPPGRTGILENIEFINTFIRGKDGLRYVRERTDRFGSSCLPLGAG